MEELLLASELSLKEGEGTGWMDEPYSGGWSGVSSYFKVVLVWLAS